MITQAEIQDAKTWIEIKSVFVCASYILVQIMQPWAPVYLYWVSGVLYYLVAVQTMHEVSHHVMSQQWWLLLSNLGIGSLGWQSKHLKHHRETNHDSDPEVNVSFMFRLHGGQKLRWYHRYQHIYCWALYGLLHLSIWYDNIIGVPHPWRGAYYTVEKPSVRYFRKALFIWLHVGWPWMVTGNPFVFLYELIAWIIPSLWITICFQASHVMHTILYTDTEWDAMAWCADNVWVTEITGGLNLQPYHHRYPSVSHTLLPRLREVTDSKDRAPETTFIGAIKEHYLAMKLLGRR